MAVLLPLVTANGPMPGFRASVFQFSVILMALPGVLSVQIESELPTSGRSRSHWTGTGISREQPADANPGPPAEASVEFFFHPDKRLSLAAESNVRKSSSLSTDLSKSPVSRFDARGSKRRSRSVLSSSHQRHRHGHKLPRRRRHRSPPAEGTRFESPKLANNEQNPNSLTKTDRASRSRYNLIQKDGKGAKTTSNQPGTKTNKAAEKTVYTSRNNNTSESNNLIHDRSRSTDTKGTSGGGEPRLFQTGNAPAADGTNLSFRDIGKRSTPLRASNTGSDDSATERTSINLVVLLPEEEDRLFSIKRVRPAIKLATENVTQSRILTRHKLVTSYADSKCHIAEAMNEAIKAVMAGEVHAFLGPVCDYSASPVARQAKYWNIPVITSGAMASDYLLRRSTLYPMLTRVGPNYDTFIAFIATVCDQFNFTKVFLAYDPEGQNNVLDKLCHVVTDGLHKAFGGNPYSKYNISSDYAKLVKKADIQHILEDRVGADFAVIIMCASPNSVREIMIKAHELQFDQGEYVFFNIDLFSSHNATAKAWYRADDTEERNVQARAAYDSLMTVSLRKPTSQAYEEFSQDVRAKSASMYKNFTYGDQEVNSFVGAFHDAVMLYALALNETIEAGGNVSDGLSITARMWNRSFTGITGTVSIDKNGDRNADYSLLDLNPDKDRFEVVADYFGTNKTYTPYPGRRVHWPGGRTRPPPDTPACGFDRSKCPPKEPFPEYGIVIIVLGSSLLVVLIVTFFVYRHFRLESELAEMNWRVRWDDIMFGGPTRNGKKMDKQNSHRNSYHSDCSADTIAVHLNDVGNRQLFTKTGYYKGAILAIKPISRTHISITKPLLVEIKKMKDLQNDHLVRFHGVCIDIPNQCILTEYCPKGSLQDVLENDQIKLDWMFRYSIMQDIVRGMTYLHSTDVKSHGHLKSSNCVVDSRFVVKITDFGLHYFKEKEEELVEDTYALERNKLWVAPELLRMASPPCCGTQKGDVFSFAIICQEIVYRNGAFYLQNLELSPKEITDKLRKGMKPVFRPTLEEFDCPNDELARVIRRCWAEEAAERPDFQALRTMIKKLNKDGDKGDILDNLLTRMEQYANNLEALVEERTSDYLQEKKKAEELLYNMLPKSVAHQLIRGESIAAEWYDGVTIYFSDICGFTALSAASTPMQVVDLLNDLYTVFDSIVEDFDVYKVETIGDAYMVVSGLPVRNGNLHAREIARMSLALLDNVFRFKIRHRPGDQLKLRIGIHSGPVCAGVVGHKMPRYCLFGDTVNTSSRMESNGLPLRIHVSPFTHEILQQFGTFQLEMRGPVEMKGKGVVTTYWLMGEEASPYNIRQQGCNEPSLVSDTSATTTTTTTTTPTASSSSPLSSSPPSSRSHSQPPQTSPSTSQHH